MSLLETSPRYSLAHTLSDPLSRLKVPELKMIIRLINDTVDCAMRVSGVKSDLIGRIVRCISAKESVRDFGTIQTILFQLNRVASGRERWVLSEGVIYCWSQMTVEQRNTYSQSGSADVHEKLSFSWKPNPFYDIVTDLTSLKMCQAAMGNRKTETFRITLTSEQQVDLQKIDAIDGRRQYDVRFLCGSAEGKIKSNVQIEFPTSAELRVNYHSWTQQTLRGTKNRPGTVNAPNLTHQLALHSINTVEMVYMYTTKPYFCQVVLTKRKPIYELVNYIVKSQTIPKETVLEKIQEWRNDGDVVMQSETVSMRCPLGFTRIKVPCRFKVCCHTQCFDATNFLAMNEQTPSWVCPVCSNRIDSIDDLVVDSFFVDILNTVNDNVEKVLVEADGRLQVLEEAEQNSSDEDEEEPNQRTSLSVNLPNVVLISDDDETEDWPGNHTKGDNDRTVQNLQGEPDDLVNSSEDRGLPSAPVPDISGESQQPPSNNQQQQPRQDSQSTTDSPIDGSDGATMEVSFVFRDRKRKATEESDTHEKTRRMELAHEKDEEEADVSHTNHSQPSAQQESLSGIQPQSLSSISYKPSPSPAQSSTPNSPTTQHSTSTASFSSPTNSTSPPHHIPDASEKPVQIALNDADGQNPETNA